MCGIVGYVGTKPAAPILVDGLARLEYRGYDSAGVAVLGSSELRVHKDAGRVRELEASLPKRFGGKLGIGEGDGGHGWNIGVRLRDRQGRGHVPSSRRPCG